MVTFTRESGKVVYTYDNGEFGGEIDPSAVSRWSATSDSIYIFEFQAGNRSNGFKFKITDINGRPNDIPEDVVEFLRTNFFFNVSGLGEFTPTVPTFNDLPDPATFAINTVYFVEQSTGYTTIGGVSIPTSINAKKFGFYFVFNNGGTNEWRKIKGGFTAREIFYDNTSSTSPLVASTVFDAINELDANANTTIDSIIVDSVGQDLNAAPVSTIAFATQAVVEPAFTYNGVDGWTMNRTGFIVPSWSFIANDPVGANVTVILLPIVNGVNQLNALTLIASTGVAGSFTGSTYGGGARIPVTTGDLVQLRAIRLGAAASALNTLDNFCSFRIEFVLD